MASPDVLKSIAQALPENPGVYTFHNSDGEILYVGKAKNLRKRMASYFVRTLSGKTKVMVGKISEINHTVVDTESEALLLENNLIKKHQPRYNVLMKDDKTFPWICIKNEPFPRIFLTRNIINDGSIYFGPYTSVVMIKTLLGLIRQLYPLRTCSYNLAEEKIREGKYRVCLEYHIGNCKAPCVGEQSENEYNKSVEQIREILRGNIHMVNNHLKGLMSQYASDLKYEEAQLIKEKLKILEIYRSRSTVVNPRIKDVDVFGFTEEREAFYVNYLRIIRGAIIQTHTLEFRKRLEEKKNEIISLAITELRERHQSVATEIIVPFVPDIQLVSVKYTVPRKGDKKKLLELAERNALIYRLNQQKRIVEHKPADRTRSNLEKLQQDLRLPELPVHIECFDNSNIQGSYPVAACVVFRNGRSSKRDYRHYHIKTVKGADDFASMEEVVFRRYRRLIDEDEALPQLVIIDGGKGQLNSAVRSIDNLGLRGKISIIGIAKKLEEIYFPGDSVPIYISKNSVSLKIIQQIRNEAHRFGINFHRDQRSKKMTGSQLDQISGIGEKTRERLLKEFGSIWKIASAKQEELEKLVGRQKAGLIVEFFKNLT